MIDLSYHAIEASYVVNRTPPFEWLGKWLILNEHG